MIAALLKLSKEDALTLRLWDAYSLHKAVYDLFPKIEGRERDFLYADRPGKDGSHVVVTLSRRAPMTPKTGDLETVEIPDSYLERDFYAFELTVNPTKRDKASGALVAVKGRGAICEWFAKKAPSFGFEVDLAKLQAVDDGVQSFSKDGKTEIVHAYAVLKGVLRVLERPLFKRSFQNGIGRAKGFGFGLLQVVPLDSALASFGKN